MSVHEIPVLNHTFPLLKESYEKIKSKKTILNIECAWDPILELSWVKAYFKYTFSILLLPIVTLKENHCWISHHLLTLKVSELCLEFPFKFPTYWSINFILHHSTDLTRVWTPKKRILFLLRLRNIDWPTTINTKWWIFQGATPPQNIF